MSRYLAIDIDPQGLFVVSGTARGGTAKLERALAWTADANGEGGPPVLTAESARSIGEQLRERLRAAGISPAPAIVAIGRDRIILKELKYPQVPAAEEPALVRFQTLKELTESPDEIVLDYTPLNDGAAAGERRSMAVVLRRELFGAIRTMCEAAGLRLNGVTPRPYAVAAGQARAVAMGAAEKPESATEAVAVISIGPQGGEFTVVRQGEVTFTRSIPGPAAASDSLLAAEVRRNLAVYAGTNASHPVQTVYVAEAGAGGPARRLRSTLAIPAHPYDPLAGAVEDVPTTLRGRFAGATGLLAGRATDALPINFVSPRQPRPAADPKRTLILVGMLVGIVLLAGAGVYGMMQLSAADRKLAEANRRKTEAEQDVARWEAEAARAAAIRKWRADDVAWADELYDTTIRFPVEDGARATSVTTIQLKSNDPKKPPPAQAQVDLKFVAPNSTAATGLVSTLAAANPTGSKHYADAKQTPGGKAPGGNGEVFTVTFKVFHWPLDRFTLQPGSPELP